MCLPAVICADWKSCSKSFLQRSTLISNAFGVNTLSVKVSVPASTKSQVASLIMFVVLTLLMFLLNFIFSNTVKNSKDFDDFNAAPIYCPAWSPV